VILFVGVAMIGYGITALWFGMRDVLEVGGFCAEGGAYVIQQTCPDRAELLIFTGIPAGVIGIFVALFGCARSARGSAGMLLLGWPALFLSLGFNFIYFAINPPDAMGSTIGWWISGIVFCLMGAPALLLLPSLIKAIQPERRNAFLAVFLAGAIIGTLIAVKVAGSAA